MAKKTVDEAEQTDVKKSAKSKSTAFVDNNNVLYEDVLKLDATKDLKFSLLEHKKSGIMRMGVRVFSHTDTYDGPTRNGIMLTVTTPESVEQLQRQFNTFFEKVKESC